MLPVMAELGTVEMPLFARIAYSPAVPRSTLASFKTLSVGPVGLCVGKVLGLSDGEVLGHPS
jgi:hypothetical protein